MANVVDSLVLELGLDPTKFTDGQRQALESLRKLQEQMEKSGKEADNEGKRIESFFTRLKTQSVALLAGYLGAREIARFVEETTKADAALGRISKTTHMSTQELSVWRGAIERMGGSGEAVLGTIQGLTDEINRFSLTGQSGLLEPLANLQIFLDKGNGQFKTAGELLREINKAIQGMDAGRARSLLKMMGIDDDTINTLLSTTDAFNKLLAEQEKIAAVTERSSKASQEYQSSLNRLWQVMTDIGRQIRDVFLHPLSLAFDKLSERLQRFRDWMRPGVDRALQQTGSPGSLPSVAGPAISGTRGDRNNNPGNIEYGPFAIAHGATGSDGRFAIFPTAEAGAAAMGDLLRKNYQGLTLSQIQSKWVGNSDPNYLRSMMAATGLGANDVPNLADPSVRNSLMFGMTRGEGTHLSGLTSFGSGGASTNIGGDRTTTYTTNIGTITVHGAKDAESVGRDIGPAMRRASFAAQVNTGLE